MASRQIPWKFLPAGTARKDSVPECGRLGKVAGTLWHLICIHLAIITRSSIGPQRHDTGFVTIQTIQGYQRSVAIICHLYDSSDHGSAFTRVLNKYRRVCRWKWISHSDQLLVTPTAAFSYKG